MYKRQGAPRSDFMAQSLVLSIDVCPGLRILPLRTNIWLEFSQADLGPRSAQGLFVLGFLKSLKLFFRRFALAHSERYRNRLAGIFEIQLFMETSRSHCHRYQHDLMSVLRCLFEFGRHALGYLEPARAEKKKNPKETTDYY